MSSCEMLNSIAQYSEEASICIANSRRTSNYTVVIKRSSSGRNEKRDVVDVNNNTLIAQRLEDDTPVLEKPCRVSTECRNTAKLQLPGIGELIQSFCKLSQPRRCPFVE